MKLVPVLAAALAAVCVTTSAAQETAGLYEDAGFSPIVVGQELKMTPALRRQLQTGSSSTETPSTTAPATTTAPTPTTATPARTTATPARTTATPARTTATPTTTAPTPTTATPEATTEAPTATTATPESTTATPEATTETPSSTTATPEATTASPSSTTATPSATSPASSTSTDTTATSSSSSATSTLAPTATESTVSSSSGSASSTSSDTSSGSSMSTGAVIGIVVGIVAAVAIIATVIMCVIRKRREADDDPLSPFELSMDKGGFSAQNTYNPRAIGGSASGSTRTPPADAVAAGVAYSQFYDNATTSPGSMNRLESNVDSVQTDPGNPATNGTNLWLSAMEPKDNDSYLSAQESPRSSHNSSRNSYEVSSNQAIDVDQSSQISGNSNKESDDFPDHHGDNDSARGSYEL